jgi:hypothetical protein
LPEIKVGEIISQHDLLMTNNSQRHTLNDFLKKSQEQQKQEVTKKDGESIVPIFKKDSSDDANEILLGGAKKGSTPPKTDNVLEEETKVEEEVPQKDWFSILDKEETKKEPIDITDLQPLYSVKKDRSEKKSVLASVISF